MSRRSALTLRPGIFAPRHFRSRLATIRPSGNRNDTVNDMARVLRQKKARSAKRQVELAEVAFGASADLGPVMIPVRARNLSERRRAQIVSEAREFHAKGRFIQECTNPKFLWALAGDFFDSFAPLELQRYVPGQFARLAIEDYF